MCLFFLRVQLFDLVSIGRLSHIHIASVLGDEVRLNSELIQLQQILLEAVFDESALELALQKFAEICDAPISQLMVAQTNRTLLRSIFSTDLDVDLGPTEVLYQDINPRVLATPSMKKGKATRDQDFISYDQIQNDQTYQELIVPAGLGHFSGVPVIHDEHMIAGIALHRPIGAEAFNDTEAEIHEIASAVCGPVLQLASLVERSNVRSTLDLIGNGRAVAILDYAGRVHTHNEAFEAMLTQRIIRIEKDRKLTLNSRSARAALTLALGKHSQIVGGSFAIKSRDLRAQWLCRVVPKPAFTIAGPEAGHALLICDQIDKPLQLDLSLVRDFFGLTKTEGEIANLVYQGHSPKDIASKRRVSVETVRSHLKSLLHKTESNRQVELVAKLSRFTKHPIA